MLDGAVEWSRTTDLLITNQLLNWYAAVVRTLAGEGSRVNSSIDFPALATGPPWQRCGAYFARSSKQSAVFGVWRLQHSVTPEDLTERQAVGQILPRFVFASDLFEGTS